MHGMARGDELIGDRLWRYPSLSRSRCPAPTPGSLASDHLSLIFLIILLFAAYPAAFAALSLAFLRTFHLVLAGMVRRGAAFVFRTYRTCIGGAHRIWGRVIAIPWCDRDRGPRVVDGVVQPFAGVSWLQPFR